MESWIGFFFPLAGTGVRSRWERLLTNVQLDLSYFDTTLLRARFQAHGMAGLATSRRWMEGESNVLVPRVLYSQVRL